MSQCFRISVTFLDGRFHGQLGNEEPEWPPSPLRLFQAIVAANSQEVESDEKLTAAMHWLEKQGPPSIITPPTRIGAGYVLSVPNNAMDIVGRAWSNGNYFGTGDANPAKHHTMKSFRPVQLLKDAIVHYLWPLSELDSATEKMLDLLVQAARRVCTLGWGIDMAIASAGIVEAESTENLNGRRWKPNVSTGGTALRAPRRGTLKELRRRHRQFLSRISESGFAPVDPLTVFDFVGYQPTDAPASRPFVVFELRNDHGDFFTYPQRKLIHIAGMARHLAIETMKHDPPPMVDDPRQWADQFVAGHAKDNEGEHRQFSYIPLPSIGHRHADHTVRRVMISAPPGDDRLLDHLATRLAGKRLKPAKGTPIENPPTLIRIYHDKMARWYSNKANTWASVTPVVLPGHTDHKPAKTVNLIKKALRQSGIKQPCTFEWRSISWWPKALTAYKYDRDRRPTGYLRPDHLKDLSLVHIKLRFNDDLSAPGPIAIGAGRHYGLGLLAGVQE